MRAQDSAGAGRSVRGWQMGEAWEGCTQGVRQGRRNRWGEWVLGCWLVGAGRAGPAGVRRAQMRVEGLSAPL